MGLCNADRCNNFGFDVDAGLGARRDYFDTLRAGRRARLIGATKAGTRRPPTSAHLPSIVRPRPLARAALRALLRIHR